MQRHVSSLYVTELCDNFLNMSYFQASFVEGLYHQLNFVLQAIQASYVSHLFSKYPPYDLQLFIGLEVHLL